MDALETAKDGSAFFGARGAFDKKIPNVQPIHVIPTKEKMAQNILARVKDLWHKWERANNEVNPANEATFTSFDKAIRYMDFKEGRKQIQILTKEKYEARAKEIGQYYDYWIRGKTRRWNYMKIVASWIKETDPKAVLEAGPRGMRMVDESFTIGKIDKEIPEPLDYVWDLNNIPYPIATRQYDLFVAMRVYHHVNKVTPKQTLDELFRIADNIILVLPDDKALQYIKAKAPDKIISGINSDTTAMFYRK